MGVKHPVAERVVVDPDIPGRQLEQIFPDRIGQGVEAGTFCIMEEVS